MSTETNHHQRGGGNLGRSIAPVPKVSERCQFDDNIYRLWPPVRWMRSALYAFRRYRDRQATRRPMGAPSRFQEGAWVRVKGAQEIRMTLDGDNKLRGLEFLDSQWGYCGGTYQVDRVMSRLRDDGRRFRAISRTVALRGVTCDGVDGRAGCGRSCALFFRDEWLEPAAAPQDIKLNGARFARVRPWRDICATLDQGGRRDGMSVMAEMEQLSGERYPVLRQAGTAGESQPAYKRLGGEFFILDGVRCSGAAFAELGPCHRRCAIIWHRDWLDFEDAPPDGLN